MEGGEGGLSERGRKQPFCRRVEDRIEGTVQIESDKSEGEECQHESVQSVSDERVDQQTYGGRLGGTKSLRKASKFDASAQSQRAGDELGVKNRPLACVRTSLLPKKNGASQKKKRLAARPFFWRQAWVAAQAGIEISDRP